MNNVLNISLKGKKAFSWREWIGTVTGFIDNHLVVITGDAANRKIALSGTINCVYKGEIFDDFYDGYESPAHDNVHQMEKEQREKDTARMQRDIDNIAEIARSNS